MASWSFYLPHCYLHPRKVNNHTHVKVYLDENVYNPENCKLHTNSIFCGSQEAFYKYDIFADKWEFIPKVKGSAMTIYNDKLYIIGKSGLFECNETSCNALIRYDYNIFEAPYFQHIARIGSMWYLTRQHFFSIFPKNVVLELDTLRIREEVDMPKKEEKECIVDWVDDDRRSQGCFLKFLIKFFSSCVFLNQTTKKSK